MSRPIVQIVTPPVAGSDIDMDLVNLTRWLTESAAVERYAGGILGGEWGYGVEFENEVFSMFPFCWGECECGWDVIGADIAEEPHDAACYQADLAARFEADGLGYDRETWAPRSPNLSYDERRAREDRVYRDLTTKYGLSMAGCAVHCTCTHPGQYQTRFEAAKLGPEGHAGDCPTIRANFLHKPSGLRIDWYKWIGRDMEFRPAEPDPATWRSIFEEVIASVAVSR